MLEYVDFTYVAVSLVVPKLSEPREVKDNEKGELSPKGIIIPFP